MDFLMMDILTSGKWYLMVVFTCIPLLISDAEHLFMCFLGYLCVFFGKAHLFFTWSQVYTKDYISSLSAITCRGCSGSSLCFAGLLGERAWGGCATVERLWVTRMPPRAGPSLGCRKSSWSPAHDALWASAVAALHSGWISCCSIRTRVLLWPRTPCSHSFLSLLGCNLWLPGRSLLTRPCRGRCTNERSFKDPERSCKAPISALPRATPLSCLPWGLELRIAHPPVPQVSHSLGMLHTSSALFFFFFFKKNTSNFTHGTELFHKRCVGREKHTAYSSSFKTRTAK